MTDKELLELAAKAAGQNGVYQHWEDSRGRVSSGIAPDGAPGRMWWNPLTDDGDALRLAAKLCIHVLQYGTVTTAKHVDSTVCFDERGDGQSDKTQEAATRRAIVRAAAEIGKAL